MGKEEDNGDPRKNNNNNNNDNNNNNNNAALMGFSGHLCAAALEKTKVGWMGAGPRTPLRALIARESSDGSFQTLSQPTDDPTPLLAKSSLWARTRGEEAGSARKSAASSRRRSGSCEVKGGSPSSTTPPSSGCSSPITRLGHASHKMRAVAIPPTPNCMAEFLRPVQLGALFAQERENQTCTSRTLVDHGGQPPLRDLIAAELAGTCRAPGVGFLPPVAMGSSFRSPSSGNRNSEGNHADCRQPPDLESSQELRYLFAKDWALQTSDEDDQFWDSGSLCGLASPSPSPRWSGHDQRRRRTKKRHSKLRSSSHCTPAAARPTSELGTQRSPPFPTPSPTPTSIASLQELHAHSPGHVRFIPNDAPCGHGPKSSLGSLLAEEIAASSLEATWSAPSQSSRRPKIGSLSDISAPVRPESQSQLDFLIAKILTLRANSMEAKSSNATTAALAGEPADDGGCSTSGSNMQGTAADIVRVAEDKALVCAPPDSSSSSSSSAAAAADPASDTDANLSIVDGPIVMNPPIPDIGEAPDFLHSTQQEPHSSVMTSTVGETIDSPSVVTDAGETVLRHEGDHGYDEPAEDMARSSSEVEAPALERVQLGTLLEQTRGEHGWIPLGRSRMGSPLSLVGSQQQQQQVPASSSTSSRLNNVSTEVVSADDMCHHPSARELVVSPRSSPGSPRSPELGTFQQAADPPPESTTGTERASSTMTAAAATVSPVVDAAAAGAGSAIREQQRPPTQRVSLLSLLNQDMDMDLEDGLHLVLCGGGCRLDEEPEEPADTEELDPMCCVCMVGHKGAAFIPCGHTFCRRCCREVRRSIGSCPLCNQAIVDVLNLY